MFGGQHFYFMVMLICIRGGYSKPLQEQEFSKILHHGPHQADASTILDPAVDQLSFVDYISDLHHIPEDNQDVFVFIPVISDSEEGMEMRQSSDQIIPTIPVHAVRDQFEKPLLQVSATQDLMEVRHLPDHNMPAVPVHIVRKHFEKPLPQQSSTTMSSKNATTEAKEETENPLLLQVSTTLTPQNSTEEVPSIDIWFKFLNSLLAHCNDSTSAVCNYTYGVSNENPAKSSSPPAPKEWIASWIPIGHLIVMAILYLLVICMFVFLYVAENYEVDICGRT
ncbi:hypothetical protein SK128_004935, partial [Halocaridina rubra]